MLVLVTKPYETVLESAVELTHDEINILRNYPDIQSAGASIQNILLTAVDMGYGACWLSGAMFARQEIEKMLNIKAPEKALAFVVIGRPRRSISRRLKPNLADPLEIYRIGQVTSTAQHQSINILLIFRIFHGK